MTPDDEKCARNQSGVSILLWVWSMEMS